MPVGFCCVCFSFSVLSQEIGYEERLQNDLLCVEWVVKLNSVNQLVHYCLLLLLTYFSTIRVARSVDVCAWLTDARQNAASF